MLLVFVIVFCALVALGFGAASAWSDYTRLTIPNMYAVFIGAAFIPAFAVITFFAPEVSLFSSWINHLMAFIIVFGVTYCLFFFKMIGGGDSKLLSVYALWVGLGGLMPMLFFMAIVGGILAILTKVMNNKKLVEKPIKGSWIDKSQSGAQDVPYGVAIFIGALVSFWQVGYLQPASLAQLATSGMGS